jgi:hypothetical protein
MQEIWKQIPGWEGYYSVSNLGRVKSENRIIVENTSFHKTLRIPERILKQTLNNVGQQYWRVSLSKNSKVTYKQVHQLVCSAFIGFQKKDIEVRHLNGNCRDNRLENLTYGTKTENMQDALRHGTLPIHEKRPGAKLNKQKAVEIVLSKDSIQILAKRYNVGVGCIRQVNIGETWESITKEARIVNPYKFRKAP